MPKDAEQKVIEGVTKDLIARGLLIEAGFAMFAVMTIPKHASKDQLADMRVAYFAGAQHLFGSVMTMLDGGDEPTEADMKRMTNIHEELERFTVQLSERLKQKP